MLFLLSPAKRLDYESPVPPEVAALATAPKFMSEAAALIDVMKAKTPLQVAEKPEPPPPPGNNTDSRTYRPKRDTREDVIAAVRELMGLGPNDPTPVPPPAPKPAEPEKPSGSEEAQ